ncbi:ABC transporter permease [Luedemannella helvata]|uniref:ABC transporter permease n=1 Tax=Luedemannella helvata TaxID=349315 RepID=A0ABP4X8A7_9ACTN
MSVEKQPSGVIHDIGYQRYTGARLGRSYATRSLYIHSLRTALGLGRGPKAKIFPWLAEGILLLVAAIVTAIRAQGGEAVLSYSEFAGQLSFLLILFCAATAPELVSRDLRSGVLPLYFSRPIRRSDYAFGKLAGMATATWLLLAVPQTLMFIGGVFSVSGVSAVWDETIEYGQGLLASALFALLFGAISILIASLAGRRAVTAALIVVAFLVTTPIYAVIQEVGSGPVKQLAGLINPVTLVLITNAWLTGDDLEGLGGNYGAIYALSTLIAILVCVLLLLLRYRKVAR